MYVLAVLTREVVDRMDMSDPSMMKVCVLTCFQRHGGFVTFTNHVPSILNQKKVL